MKFRLVWCSVGVIFPSITDPKSRISPQELMNLFSYHLQGKYIDHDRRLGMGGHTEEERQEGSPRTMAMVSSSMGAINSLMNKLPAERKFTELRQYLHIIQQHLLGFCARGVLVSDRLDRHWMKKLRDLAYDIEDWIDKLRIQSGCQFEPESDGSDMLQEFKKKSCRRAMYIYIKKKLKLCYKAVQLGVGTRTIREFKKQILYLQDLGQEFGLLTVGFADLVPSNATLDLEDTTPEEIMHDDGILCLKQPCIVGLSDQEREIAGRLIDDEKWLKVVSILGPGGLGKTTLAREVFQKHRSQFECGAIVHVGRYPSIDDTLMDVVRQVMPNSFVPCGKKRITLELSEFLRTKRYLIVIENIWTIESWARITCAFPHNKLGSRILATTEDEKLAKFCCVQPINFIFLLKPLADCDSRLLLLSRMSLSEEDCPIDPSILKSMLKVCCGNPLALVVAAGLLAAKAKGTGHHRVFENTVLSMMKQDYGKQEVAKILDMSYNDLPLHLKSCFLYLSAFPENCTISKDRLIRRWVAEGFIPSREGESSWGIGDRYFKELARRGLIQLVLNDINDEIGCTIHNTIHEFIRSLSVEENFVTIGEHLSSQSYLFDTRRFTHDCSRQLESGVLGSMMVHLSKVRSLAVSGNTNNQLSDASTFKLLRVLDLEGATGLGKCRLRSIRKLVLLRYLGLRGSDAYQLPEKMTELQHLETMDLRQTKVNHLPQLATAKLVSLHGDHLVIPRGMDDMLELEELSMIVVSHNRYSVVNAAKLIGKSELLRVLGVRFESCDDQVGLMCFLEAVNKSSLRTFSVDDYSGAFLGWLENLWCPIWWCLDIFELNISHYLIPKVPERIVYLNSLTHLHIRVHVIEAEGLHVLEGLPNLLLLDLGSHDTLERCIISNEGCFRNLKVFWLRCLDSGMGLQFGPGAMPQLRRFKLVFGAKQTEDKFGDFDFGIENLICLEEVSVTINCSTHASEAALRDQVSKIPNNPLLELRSVLTE